MANGALAPPSSNAKTHHLIIATGRRYKVKSWQKGEPIECQSCQNVTLSLNQSDSTVAFRSTWLAQHCAHPLHPYRRITVSHAIIAASGRPSVSEATACAGNGSALKMNALAYMSPDPSRGVGKLFNSGVMLGLTFWEPYTVVYDGLAENEPFVV